MEIIHANKEDHKKIWQSYTDKSPGVSLYHLYEWKDIMEVCFGHRSFYLMAVDEGQIYGILPIIFINSYLFGSIFCSMPFLNFGGLISDNLEAEEALLAEAKNLMLKHKVDYLELRQLNKNLTSLTTKDHKVSMTVSLQSDPDILWDNFSSKHRNEIRKGKKNGIEIVHGGKEYISEFYEIISRGWRDHGTPLYSIEFFRKIAHDLHNNIDIYIASCQNKIVAAAFNGIYNGVVEGMWTYTLPKYRNKYVNYTLYWEMIKNACTSGHKTFHLGRSTKDTGGTFYKKKWNAEAKQLFWQYILNRVDELPELNVENKKYRFLMNTWRRFPLALTKIIGPPIAKNIP